jgi:hypothetical protein
MIYFQKKYIILLNLKMLPGNNNNQNENERPNMPKCEDFIKGIPSTCLFLYVAILIVWLVNLFTSIGQDYLSNTVNKTFHNANFWRLFTSLFFESSLFMIGLIILNFQTFLPLIVFFFHYLRK